MIAYPATMMPTRRSRHAEATPSCDFMSVIAGAGVRCHLSRACSPRCPRSPAAAMPPPAAACHHISRRTKAISLFLESVEPVGHDIPPRADRPVSCAHWSSGRASWPTAKRRAADTAPAARIFSPGRSRIHISAHGPRAISRLSPR